MKSNTKNERLEKAFCFAAYVLTFLTLTIDVIFSHCFKEGICGVSNEMLICYATAIAIILCAILGNALYKNPLPFYFEVANESLPTLTAFTYLIYYIFKSGCFLYNDFWLFSMYPLVPLGYIIICLCKIREKYLLYKKDRQYEEKQKNNNDLENDYTFCADRPISSVSEDLLKRGSFSKLLAETITKLNKDDTFTVGVFGKWGNGKTSVVRMMLDELEKQQASFDEDERTIVVHFEPWNFTDTNQLLNQFFSRLSNEFKQKDDDKLKSIGSALEEYSKAFTLAELIPDIGFWGKIISFGGEWIAKIVGKYLKKDLNSEDIQKQKEKVVNLLKEQSCKILVVIDDIDRLSNEQIRYIFQLVTSVAKFPNTIYLLVFDKDIVVKALEQVQEGSGEDYLEKVIQMPIQIPNINRSTLRNILLYRLDEILKRHSDTNFLDTRWRNIYTYCIDPFINNIRDINRLCNSVEFKLTAISSEVDFTDMVALTALEIAMPSIYSWVKNNRCVLTGDFDQFMLHFENKKAEEWYRIYEKELSDISPNGQFGVSAKKDVELALKCLSYIFPHFGQKIGKTHEVFSQDILRKNNQVAHPEKFDRYFNLTLDYVEIRKSEVIAVIETMNSNEIVELLLEKDKEEISYEFIEEIRAATEKTTFDRAEVLIEALLEAKPQLETEQGKRALSLKTSELATYATYELFESILVNDRKQYFINTINAATCNQLGSLAEVINILELAHGRLSANGRERSGFAKILSLEDLSDVESAFMDRTKELLKEKSLFHLKRWRMIFYLMENFDSEFTNKYVSSELSNDENILRFIESSVGRWTGAGVNYEIYNEYTKYLTKERVLEAIENQKNNGNLFLLPLNAQFASVAFYLYENENKKGNLEITQEMINDTLFKWCN